MRRVLVLGFILLVGTPLIGVQQGRSKVTKPAKRVRPVQKTAPTVPNYATASFDVAVDALPPGFSGHSIRAVHGRLIPPAKDEFETTAAYEGRKPKPNLEFVYAFVPSGVDAEPTATYDADKGELSIELLENAVVYAQTGYLDARAVTVARESKMALRQASNAFGTTVNVTEKYGTAWALLFGNKPARGLQYHHSYSLKADPETARSLKGQIGAAFICRIGGGTPGTAATPILDGRDHSSPATLGDPHEWDETLHYLRVDLLSVWIFDRKSGQVLFKIDGKDF